MNICINIGGKYSWVRVDIPIPLDGIWNKMFAEKQALKDLREQIEIMAETTNLEKQQLAILQNAVNRKKVVDIVEEVRGPDFSKLAEANVCKITRPFESVNIAANVVKDNGHINNGRRPHSNNGNKPPRTRKRGK